MKLFIAGSEASRIVAPRRHHLGAVAPGRDQLRDQFRRMLEIGIHHDHRAAARMAQARAQRLLMAEIAGEGEIADRGIGGGRGADRRQRAVARAVIDEHDLVAAERLQDALAAVAAIGPTLPASLWAGSTTEISGIGSLIKTSNADVTRLAPAFIDGPVAVRALMRPAEPPPAAPGPDWHTTTAAWTRERPRMTAIFSLPS